ncbi:YuiB family protein [Virgibacillus xinjiangensis]|uniref:YuiB family protein n=1 Tax=Virgibacillus xinjiangensis TaxID=393090 RepID=A0ABV7CY20_9BACI
MIQLLMSILLYFVIFFGIAFILNMLLRTKWLMAFIYPLIVIMIVDDISTLMYFTDTKEAFSTLADRFASIMPMDVIILLSGFAGTIVSGFVIKFLRKSGYQMF